MPEEPFALENETLTLVLQKNPPIEFTADLILAQSFLEETIEKKLSTAETLEAVRAWVQTNYQANLTSNQAWKFMVVVLQAYERFKKKFGGELKSVFGSSSTLSAWMGEQPAYSKVSSPE